jgi:hypothetical protein
MNDFEKMKLAKSGDKQAWSYLYIKYQNRILEISENIISENNLIDIQSEDLLQKYWIFTIESSDKVTYFGNSNFEEWLSSDFESWCTLFQTMYSKDYAATSQEKKYYL